MIADHPSRKVAKLVVSNLSKMLADSFIREFFSPPTELLLKILF